MPVLDTLNAEQREAATHRGSPLIVFAAAGTGKTQALTARIAHLVVHDGVDPQTVLAVTFTRRAATEMRERASRMITDNGYSATHLPMPFVGTFHSVCLKILRMFLVRGSSPDLQPGFMIIDPSEAKKMVRETVLPVLRSEFGHDFPAKLRHLKDGDVAAALLKTIDEWRNEGLHPDDVLRFTTEEKEGDGEKEEHARLASRAYVLYRTTCASENVCDFNDILLHTLVLLRDHPDVLTACRRRLFSHMMVDEFQDTNPAQMKFVRLLCRPPGRKQDEKGDLLDETKLVVVGDDYQAIHEWRGATVNNILDFEQEFHDVHVVLLHMNYRSLEPILCAASNVIARNSRQRVKHITHTRTHDPSTTSKIVRVIVVPDVWKEARWVVSRIVQDLRAGRKTPRDFAVLYRMHALGQPVEEELRAARVPYVIRGGVGFFQRAEVKLCVTYTRFMTHRRDADFEDVLKYPARGIGPVALSHLHALKDKRRYSSLWEAARATFSTPPNTKNAIKTLKSRDDVPTWRGAKAIGQFVKDMEHAMDDDVWRDLPVHARLRTCLDRSGVLDALRKEGEGEEDVEKRHEKYANAEAFLHLAAREEEEEEEPRQTLSEFLDSCLVQMDDGEDDDDPDKVTLSSLHGSKGLEYTHVFIVGCSNGTLPFYKADLQEERRLFYVGVTRARDRLVLLSPKKRYFNGQEFVTAASSFLDEMH